MAPKVQSPQQVRLSFSFGYRWPRTPSEVGTSISSVLESVSKTEKDTPLALLVNARVCPLLLFIHKEGPMQE